MKKAVFVLSGGLIKDKTGKWRTCGFGDNCGDIFGVINHRFRIEAVFYLCKNYPDLFVFMCGGKGSQLEELPDNLALSDVMASELEELGIPKDRILKERESNNTYDQLVKMIALSKSNGFDEIFILSNEWHIPRIEAMIEYNDNLAPLKKMKVSFLKAEEILLKYDKNKYQEKIEIERKSEGAKLRIEKENNGVEQIKNGTYRYEFKK